MKRTAITIAICWLIAALFTYTAISKLADYDNFQFGLSESPFISFMAPFLTWALPAGELILAVMLLIPRLRLTGLYLSLALLISFTVYISAMLLFAFDIPCSCGGVLEEMSWGVHIIFNGVFILLNIVAIVLKRRQRKLSVVRPNKKTHLNHHSPLTIHH